MDNAVLKDTPKVHIREIPSWIQYLILLDAVADIVELGEGGGHLVHELAERMEEEIVGDSNDHVRKSKQNFGKFQLTLVFKADRRVLDGALVHICIPVIVKKVLTMSREWISLIGWLLDLTLIYWKKELNE